MHFKLSSCESLLTRVPRHAARSRYILPAGDHRTIALAHTTCFFDTHCNSLFLNYFYPLHPLFASTSVPLAHLTHNKIVKKTKSIKKPPPCLHIPSITNSHHPFFPLTASLFKSLPPPPPTILNFSVTFFLFSFPLLRPPLPKISPPLLSSTLQTS